MMMFGLLLVVCFVGFCFFACCCNSIVRLYLAQLVLDRYY